MPCRPPGQVPGGQAPVGIPAYMPPMPPRKPAVPSDADDPTESQRFIDMAREVEVDESPGAFDRAFEKAVRPPARKREPGKGKVKA